MLYGCSFYLILASFAVLLQLRIRLGMAWPEETDQTVGSTWYLKWQSEADMSFRTRKQDGFRWFFWFFVRCFIYGYVLFHTFRFMKRKIPRILGYGPLRKDPNLRKLRRLVLFCLNFCSSYNRLLHFIARYKVSKSPTR